MEAARFPDLTWNEIAPYARCANEFFKLFPSSLAKLMPGITVQVPQGDKLFVVNDNGVVEVLSTGSYTLTNLDFPKLFQGNSEPQEELRADFIFLKIDYYEKLTFDLVVPLRDNYGNEADLTLRYRLVLVDPVKLLNQLYFHANSLKTTVAHPEILVEFLVPRLLQNKLGERNLEEINSVVSDKDWQADLAQILGSLGLEVFFDELQVQKLRLAKPKETVLAPETDAVTSGTISEEFSEPVSAVTFETNIAPETMSRPTAESATASAVEVDNPTVNFSTEAEHESTPKSNSAFVAPGNASVMNTEITADASADSSTSAMASVVNPNPFAPMASRTTPSGYQPITSPVPEPMFHVGMPGTQPMGPYPLSKLQRDAGAGLFGANMLVWTPGMPDWKPVAQIPEIAQFLPR